MAISRKPRKVAAGPKRMHKCVGGPFSGHSLALASADTMVFAVEAGSTRWRGKYEGALGRPLQWRDVPLAGG